jgi:hypothetical protein
MMPHRVVHTECVDTDTMRKGLLGMVSVEALEFLNYCDFGVMEGAFHKACHYPKVAVTRPLSPLRPPPIAKT